MTRSRFWVVLAVAAAVLANAAAAQADGLIRFRNVSFAGGVTIEVRVGENLDSATLYGTQKIARGDVWEVDTAGAPAWWRREMRPGANDGRYTDWQRVESSRSDARIDV